MSIIVPALNEQAKIGHDVEAAARFMAAHDMRGEVIVVDDGSTDDTSGAAEAAPLAPGVECRVIRAERCRGKGWAVRAGMLGSEGAYALFADSGLCVPFEAARRGLDLIRDGVCELAHASRWLPASTLRRRFPLRRRLGSALFCLVVSRMMRLPAHITDSQCGFKVYRGDAARAIYREVVTEGFMFDVETILLARRLGYRIREFRIEWTYDPDTRLRAWRDIPPGWRELRAIRRRLV